MTGDATTKSPSIVYQGIMTIAELAPLAFTGMFWSVKAMWWSFAWFWFLTRRRRDGVPVHRPLGVRDHEEDRHSTQSTGARAPRARRSAASSAAIAGVSTMCRHGE